VRPVANSLKSDNTARMSFAISALFFDLALIFIPGFIWMKIHTRYGPKIDRTQFDLILNAFIFGVASYVILYLIYRCKGWNLKLFGLETDNKRLIQPEMFPEIVFAALIALIGGVIGLYVENHKWLTRFVQLIHATNTYGDEDVWDFVFNSRSRAADFVHFRDFDQKVTYAGIVRTFSESGRLRELVLTDVIVYDFDGNEMYKVPSLYLARDRANIHIEFPIGPEEGRGNG
jgi:hypothetical protein